jgi:hypothetical protein
LSVAEQIAGSALIGASLAALLFAGAWFRQPCPPGRSVLGKVALVVALGGAVLGFGLLYLAFRLPGDLWTHFYWGWFRFLDIETITAFFLGLALLFGSQVIALLIWIIARRKQR